MPSTSDDNRKVKLSCLRTHSPIPRPVHSRRLIASHDSPGSTPSTHRSQPPFHPSAVPTPSRDPQWRPRFDNFPSASSVPLYSAVSPARQLESRPVVAGGGLHVCKVIAEYITGESWTPRGCASERSYVSGGDSIFGGGS